MEEKEEKFEFTYSALTEKERREVDSIRREYRQVKDKNEKLQRLRALDKKVKKLPSAVSWTLGTVGTLVLGLGMTMVLEWEVFFWGILVGVAGIAAVAAAYPVYKTVLNRSKKKYGDEILALSEELSEDGL